MSMVDVIEVEIRAPHHVRVLERNKSEQNADAIVNMAVMRRGVEEHFFTTCPAGKYNDNDVLAYPPPAHSGERGMTMAKEFTRHELALMASRQFSALIAAGWTPSALRAAGWTPSALIAAGWTPSALIAAGWTPSALRAAGWTPSALRAAGWTPSALRAAGWTPSALIAAGWTPSALRAAFGDIPVLEKPYTHLLADIQAKKRAFKQSTFGPERPTPEPNICNTPMCTAGHLVNMAGAAGWKLKDKYGFAGAASLIHDMSHPGWPQQNYGAIPDDWALAYIEEMAQHEANGTTPVGTVSWTD